MAGSTARTSAVIPGRAILGEAGAKKEQRAQLSGSVVPGPAILGEDAAATEEARLEMARAADAIEADNKAKKGPSKLIPKGGAAPKVAAAMSEKEAADVLKADPNEWTRVLELETKRPDGVRLQVAKALLAAGPKAKRTPMPKKFVTRLEKLVASAEPAKPKAVPKAPAKGAQGAPKAKASPAPEPEESEESEGEGQPGEGSPVDA